MSTEGAGVMITEFAHRRRLYAVRLPVLGEVLSLWLDPALRTAEISRILDRAEIRRFVQRTDDQPLDRDLAREILDDAESRAAYRAARDRALTAATDGFLIMATCPGCGGWEAELTPLALAIGLRSSYWPLVDGAGHLVPPALALTPDDLTPDDLTPDDLAPDDLTPDDLAPGDVPPDDLTSAGLPRDLGALSPAARISVRLPDGRDLPFAADPAAEAPAARHASNELFDSGIGPTRGWTPDSPGWIALLRAACLAPALGGPKPSDPESFRVEAPSGTGRLVAIAARPLADFLAVDLAYALTHVVPVPEDNRVELRCPRCDTTFAPLAMAVPWPDAS